MSRGDRPITFATMSDYGRSLSDASVWAPLARYVAHESGVGEQLGDDAGLTCGYAGTFPTVVGAEVVVKFYGHFPGWRDAFAAESVAARAVAQVPGLRVPEVLCAGEVWPGEPDCWPVLVMSRMPGTAWRDLELTMQQRLEVAHEVGQQVRALHESVVPPQLGVAGDDQPVAEVCERHLSWGSLPTRLVDEMGPFLEAAGEPRGPEVFLHADLTEDHLFVDARDGVPALSGIIDWGDAVRGDRYLELGALHLGAFGGDTALLRAFLSGYDWPIDDDFAPRALAAALRHEFDLFAQVRDLVTGADSLEVLASRLFEPAPR